MAHTDGEQGGAQLRPEHRGDGGETQEGGLPPENLAKRAVNGLKTGLMSAHTMRRPRVHHLQSR